jgi:hypothetical protein
MAALGARADPAPGDDDTVEVPDSGYLMESEYLYDRMVDRTGQLALLACGDGNMRMTTADAADAIYCSEQMAFKDGRMVGTGANQVLHYYANTMDKLGVSRLRFSDEEVFPVGAVVTVAAGYHDPDDQPSDNDGLFLFTDAALNLFYPVLCNYVNGVFASRIFLVKSVADGIAALLSPDLRYTVTGGEVSDCTVVPLVYEAENYRYETLDP